MLLKSLANIVVKIRMAKLCVNIHIPSVEILSLAPNIMTCVLWLLWRMNWKQDESTDKHWIILIPGLRSDFLFHWQCWTSNNCVTEIMPTVTGVSIWLSDKHSFTGDDRIESLNGSKAYRHYAVMTHWHFLSCYLMSAWLNFTNNSQPSL